VTSKTQTPRARASSRTPPRRRTFFDRFKPRRPTFGLLLVEGFLALDAIRSPGHRFQSSRRNLVLAGQADPVTTVFDPVQSGPDLPEQFRRLVAVQHGEVLSHDGLRQLLRDAVAGRYRNREQELGAEAMRQLERVVMLQVIDTQWKDHLLSMDHLKEGIGLRGYGQRDPLTEYKREAFDLFQETVERVKTQVVEWLFKVQIAREAPVERRNPWAEAVESHGEAPRTAPRVAPRNASGQKVGRNDPCPCGSGKKYKKCCLLKAG